MAKDTAIIVSNVYKNFHLPQEQYRSVKQHFVNLMRRRKSTSQDGTQHALQDISFEIKKGEFFGIVGRNGSGKSTLLKMIAGIYQPNQGSIGVTGKLVPFIELGVGFNPELTGRENVYLNGALLGFTKAEIDQQYDEIVRFAELEDFMDQKLKNYSSGMQVRLAFSVATTAKADILLVDEVLAVGDADFQRKCFDYFRELKKSHTTVVFVTHDMDAVREYCDRAVLIEKSKLVASGRPDKIAAKYSRMFIEQAADASKEEEKSKRWGDGRVAFTNIAITPSKITDKNVPVEITLSIQAKEAVENPLVGFMIKGPTGQPVLGTNTRIQDKKVGDMAKGESATVTFTLPNIFADGHYTIDTAVEADNGTVVSDWWEEARAFVSYEEKPAPAVMSPIIETSVIRA